MTDDHTRKMIHIRLDTKLHKAIKVKAAQNGVTIQELVELWIKKGLKRWGRREDE